jgi:DNA-damage-inducible protein D
MTLLKEINKNNKKFEDIKHIDKNGIEYWYARELQKVLEYNNGKTLKK